MDLGLAGAAAVVTGGSKGMGRATAVCLAAEGARVCILARGNDARDETVAALRKAGSPDAFGLSVDLGSADEIDGGLPHDRRALGRAQLPGQHRRPPAPGTSSSSTTTTSSSTSTSAR